MQQQKDVIFTATEDVDALYDAYEKDIAIVSFHFERPTAFAYIREARMTMIMYISQVIPRGIISLLGSNIRYSLQRSVG